MRKLIHPTKYVVAFLDLAPLDLALLDLVPLDLVSLDIVPLDIAMKLTVPVILNIHALRKSSQLRRHPLLDAPFNFNRSGIPRKR